MMPNIPKLDLAEIKADALQAPPNSPYSPCVPPSSPYGTPEIFKGPQQPQLKVKHFRAGSPEPLVLPPIFSPAARDAIESAKDKKGKSIISIIRPNI